jgi:hypothetical protein
VAEEMKQLMQQFGWDVPYIPMNVNNSDGKVDQLFADDTYIAELKRDGNRYTSIGGRFFSRKKSENKKKPETLGMPVEKTDNVPHLQNVLKLWPQMVVEGEVYYPQKKSNHVTSIMGCDGWKARMRQGFGIYDFNEDAGMWLWKEQEEDPEIKIDKDSAAFLRADHGPVHYMLFEMTYDENGNDLRKQPWTVRRDALEKFYEQNIEGTSSEDYIHISSPFEGESAKRALLKWAEENGEEGIVFKNINSDYQCDKRPQKYWYRVKGKIFADVIVLGTLPPEVEHKGKTSELATWKYWQYANGSKAELSGSEEAYKHADWDTIRPISRFFYHGWIGSIVFGLYQENAEGVRELVEAGTCSGMDDGVRDMFTDLIEDLKGQVIEVSAMERTEKGMFRHPQFERFRDDKNAADCLWEVEVGSDG